MKTFLLLLLLFYQTGWAKETFILMLHSYHEAYPWTKDQRSGFREVLDNVPGLYPLYSSEYLDTKRRALNQKYEDDFVSYLRDKYKGYRPDLIYVTDDNALNFMIHHREKLFPASPVLYSGINNREVIDSLPKESYTGIYENKDIFPNLQLIGKLFPQHKEILLIGDASETANAIQSTVQQEISKTPQYHVRCINDKHFDFVLNELKNFRGDAVLLSSIGSFQSETGHLVPLKEAIERIVASGSFHTFAMEDNYVQKGVLGGYTVHGSLTGEAIGNLALQILNHPGAPLPHSTPDSNRWVFDADVLRYHAIKLPDEIAAQSTFLNIPPTFYQQHEELITYLIYALMATVTIGTLTFIWNLYSSRTIIARREAQLHDLSESLNKAQAVSHFGNWVWDIRANTLWWSDEIYRIFGLRPQSFTPNYEAFLLRVHPEDREAIQKAVTKALSGHTVYRIVHRIIQENGTVRRVVEEGTAEYEEGKPVKMIGTVQDITEDFEREKALQIQAQIIDAVQDSIVVHDPEGRFIYLNENAWKTRGYTYDEMMAMTVKELDAPEYSNTHPEMMRAAMEQMRENGHMKIRVEHLCKNGERLPVEIYAKLITLHEKTYILSSIRDVSDQLVAQKALEESEKKYKTLVENAMVGIYRSDLSGNILYVNQTLAAMFGYSSVDQLIGQKSLMIHRDLQQREEFIRQLQEHHYVSNYELTLIDRHSDPLPVLVSATLEGDNLSGMIIDMREITQSREEVDKLSKAIEQIDDSVMITDKMGTITYVNYAFCDHTGYSKEEALGNNPRMLKSGQHDDKFYKDLWKIILHGNVFRVTIINRKKNGDIFYENKTITPLKDDRGNITGFVSSGKDVTLETMMHQDIERIATFDQLTGIYNRHKFEELFALESERSRRFSQPLSLIMIDIDHFKSVNDIFGHDTGDEVLKKLAAIIQANIRKIDIFARWGGEEFLILSPTTDLGQARTLAEKLRCAVDGASFSKVTHLTISLGISMLTKNDTFENLFKRADRGLYHAKEHGRNQIGVMEE